MGKGTSRSLVEGQTAPKAPPPCFAWSPSPRASLAGRISSSRSRLAEIEAQPVPRRRPLSEGVVDDGVLEHALDVVAGLEEGDRLDPLHHVDAGKPRVTV